MSPAATMSFDEPTYPPPSYNPYAQNTPNAHAEILPDVYQPYGERDRLYNEQASGDHVYIALMGVTGAGKSSFIQLCVPHVVIGHNLQSCTTEVEEFSFKYNSNLTVHLVDTPGFDDTNRTDVEVLRDVASWLGTAYKQNIRLIGIIYLHRISDPRMGGSARRNLGMFKKLCGEQCFSKVVLATTFWSQVNEEDGARRERELVETDDFWGYMKKKGSSIMRHDGTYQSATSILQFLLAQRKEIVLTIQEETVLQGKNLDATEAGRSIDEELLKQRRRYEREIELMQAEKEDALRARDMETYAEQQRLQREYEEKIAKIIKDRESMQVNLETVELDMARKLKELQDKNRESEQRIQREREELEHARNMDAGRRAQLEADLAEYEARKNEVKRQKKGVRGTVTYWFEKQYQWVNDNPEKAKKLMKIGKVVGKFAVAAAAH